MDDFEANVVRSKPIGSYTWSETLSSCFRFLRFFQLKFNGTELAVPLALAGVLARDKDSNRPLLTPFLLECHAACPLLQDEVWPALIPGAMLKPNAMERAGVHSMDRRRQLQEKQLLIWPESEPEDAAYLQEQLLTYIGNKRSLLGHIGTAIEKIKARLGKDRLRILDAFSGSTVVSRYCKQHAEHLVANDIEPYAALMARCYLRNRSEVDLDRLGALAADLNDRVDTAKFPPGFIQELYAPKDDNNIRKHERVFYTRENARRLDNYRRLLEALTPDDKLMLLGPLLSKASVHANTSGVFKGFYKDRDTKIGCFGGTNGDALVRIKGKISLSAPVLSQCECHVEVHQQDANQLVRSVRGLDLAYFDPPYNQHPYGSNYFMLNLLVDYLRPTRLSDVSGIPVDWQRSGYNVRSESFRLMADLVQHVDARFILVSFNDEGFIQPDAMHRLLSEFGSVDCIELPYNTFREVETCVGEISMLPSASILWNGSKQSWPQAGACAVRAVDSTIG